MPIFEYACGSAELEKKRSVFAAQNGGPDAAPAPCASGGHPGGPGSCAFD